MKKNLLSEAVVVIAVVFSPAVCLGDTAACPSNNLSDNARKVTSLLDYVSEKSSTAAASVAECALAVYRSINVTAIARTTPHKYEQLAQEVGNIQRFASQSLLEAGDIDGSLRFDRQEILARKAILGDIQQLDDDVKRVLRSERVRQITYLSQALIRQDDGLHLHEVLSGVDIDLLQSQVISAWVVAAASCPSWKMSLVGGMSDSRLKTDVCSSSCRGKVNAALDAVSIWKDLRKQDWNKIKQGRELVGRMKNSIKCVSS